jgi:hypothetical protein
MKNECAGEGQKQFSIQNQQMQQRIDKFGALSELRDSCNH